MVRAVHLSLVTKQRVHCYLLIQRSFHANSIWHNSPVDR